jgi:hypothetical protein
MEGHDDFRWQVAEVNNADIKKKKACQINGGTVGGNLQ